MNEKMAKMAKSYIGSHVVITTDKDHSGVFGGILNEANGDTLRLLDCSMAVYWSADVRGVVGLAAMGPSEGCRITPEAPEAIIKAVSAIFLSSPDAIDKWEKCPWAE